MIFTWLQRLWLLPWPAWVRRAVEPVVMAGPVQRLIVPYFRCGVVAIIQNDRGEYLLFRHTYRSQFPWGLPTGYLEHGEQPNDAIHREIAEESGLSVEIGPVWRVYTDSREIINIVFRGSCPRGDFRASAEISEAQFFALDELPALMSEQRGLLEASEMEVSDARSSGIST